MATQDIDGLRAYYDSHDTTVELENSELDESALSEPMVGITIRLPATALDAAREVARERGIRVTALLREWIEQNLGDEAGDDRLVSVRDLKSLIAQKSTTARSGSNVTSRSARTGGQVGKTALTRSPATGASATKARKSRAQ